MRLQLKIYVGNIPRAASDEEVKALFETYGKVHDCTVIKDRFDGSSKGFGFVEMDDEEGKAAIEALNGYTFQGRPLTVNVARPREERPGGGMGMGPRNRGGYGRPDSPRGSSPRGGYGPRNAGR